MCVIESLSHVRKLPVTWGEAVIFAEYSGFLHYLQLASHELATIGHKCDRKQNSKLTFVQLSLWWTM